MQRDLDVYITLPATPENWADLRARVDRLNALVTDCRFSVEENPRGTLHLISRPTPPNEENQQCE